MSSSSIASDQYSPSPTSIETPEPRTSWSYATESVAWCLLALVLVLSLWRPSDTAVSIGFGDSIWHIGLSLLGFLSAALFSSTLIAGKSSQLGSSHRLSLLWLLLALVVLWHAMVTGYSIGRTNLRNSIYGFWQSTSMWLLLPTIAWLVRWPSSAARLLKLWWVLAVFVLAWGFWEYGVIQPMQRAAFAKDRIGFLQQNKIDPESSAAVLIVNRLESTEVLSVFALANSYAAFLVALWPIWLGWMIQVLRTPRELGDYGAQTSQTKADRLLRIVPVVLVLLTGLALLLTKSRTAWVAAGVSTVLAFALDPALRAELGRWLKNNPLLIAGILIGVLAIFGGVYALDPLIFQEAGKSLSYRMDYWKGALELIGQQPLYGFGSLNFQPTYLQVKKLTASESPADPHNFILELAHSGGWGLLGLTMVLLMMLCFRGLGSRLFASQSPQSPFAIAGADAKEPWVMPFRLTVILCAIAVFMVAFFRVGDLELVGTAVAIALAFGSAYWLSREQPSASVQAFVLSHPVLFLVSFLGVMVHFLASGGWMFPGTMIAPMLAMGMWIASSRWTQAPQNPSRSSRLTKWLAPMAASVLLALWGLTMAWPHYQSQRIMQTFARDAQGRLLIDSQIADKTFPTSDQYAMWIASVPHDPELARWGLDLSATVLDSKLPTPEKISWLHQFQEACKLLIERDPKHSVAYAEAASQSLRASIAQMLDPSLNDELAFRRQGGGPALRASGTGGGRPRGGGGGGGGGGPARSIATLLLQDSLKYYQESTKFAPASAELHLQTAVVAAMQGNWKVCQGMLEQAEEIDRQTPHRDRKIESTKIWIPREMVKSIQERATAGKKISDEGNPEWDKLKILIDRSDSVPGEPVRQTLRSFFKES
ncbi:MAG: O-antigen ligase family protein [Planctomycetota bacterium]